MNPNIALEGKKYHFKEGNRTGGRPPGTPDRRTALRKFMELGCSIIDPITGEPLTATIADKVSMALIEKAAKGDVAAIALLFDSYYGKIVQSPETPNTGPDVDYSKLTTEELQELARLSRKARGEKEHEEAEIIE